MNWIPVGEGTENLSKDLVCLFDCFSHLDARFQAGLDVDTNILFLVSDFHLKSIHALLEMLVISP